MDGKIALEEHFVTPELEDLVLNPGWPEDAFRRTLDRLADVEGERLELMDRYGIAVAVLSLASHGIQGIPDPRGAVARAREANDALVFAADHPFEDIADGAGWFDALDLDDAVRSKIAYANAERLLDWASAPG